MFLLFGIVEWKRKAKRKLFNELNPSSFIDLFSKMENGFVVL